MPGEGTSSLLSTACPILHWDPSLAPILSPHPCLSLLTFLRSFVLPSPPTGYEWNKYNQTHYDGDNPPPKTVQVGGCVGGVGVGMWVGGRW